ncbi:MAG: tetratricopeptide repeat protein [Bacteroidota bacterium]
MEIEDKTYHNIVALSHQGNDYFDSDEYEAAIKCFKKAFELVPVPKNDYEASSWLLSAIGDCLFFKDKYSEAIAEFKYSETCEGGLNSFNWLRLGQCYYFLNDTKNARLYLLKAYTMDGEELFSDENQVYLNVIRDLIK